MEMQEDVYERAKIQFPRSLERDSIRFFLSHISKNLKSRINYNIKYDEVVDTGIAPVGGSVRSIELNGTIYRSIFASSTFNSYTEMTSSRPVIDGIKFFVTPGYNVNEIREDEIKLWDDFRESSNRFFEEYKP